MATRSFPKIGARVLASAEALEFRLQHRFDVGGEGREAVDEIAYLGRGDAVLDRQREDVDQLIASMPEKVRADDAIRLFVDQHF